MPETSPRLPLESDDARAPRLVTVVTAVMRDCFFGRSDVVSAPERLQQLRQLMSRHTLSSLNAPRRALFVSDVVDALDLSPILATYETGDGRGPPPRSPIDPSHPEAEGPAELHRSRVPDHTGWGHEALRPGRHRPAAVDGAAQVTVLGDGAPWIWGIAEEHFPGATQIVDLYHAREHLAALGKLFYGPGSAAAKPWVAARTEDLDAGAVERLLAALGRLRPRGEEAQEAIRKTQGYFETNAARMHYPHFRRQGLFVGSGVVEAGCKTVVGLRLKQSGMRWTVQGANAIIALRC